MVVVPAKMGRINKRTLLGRLQRMGLASRAELAKSLGMSQPTAGKIADELLELGVLEEVDGEDVPLNRPRKRRLPARGLWRWRGRSGHGRGQTLREPAAHQRRVGTYAGAG